MTYQLYIDSAKESMLCYSDNQYLNGKKNLKIFLTPPIHPIQGNKGPLFTQPSGCHSEILPPFDCTI